MLPEQIGECFVRQFLNGAHPVARQLLQLVESIIVEGDQLAHALPAPTRCGYNDGQLKWFRRGTTSIALSLNLKGRFGMIKTFVMRSIVAIALLASPVISFAQSGGGSTGMAARAELRAGLRQAPAAPWTRQMPALQGQERLA